jgi:phosphoserine phosphatase RsbU/P
VNVRADTSGVGTTLASFERSNSDIRLRLVWSLSIVYLSRMWVKVRNFWQRISEGLAIQELWKQFHADVRASYRLYTKDLEPRPREGVSRWKRFWPVAKGLFLAAVMNAMMMKLSPGRRILFLIALVLLFFPTIQIGHGENGFDSSDAGSLAGIILLILLALELADRVSMKRDLEIAREIQSWLMPLTPPAVPGLDIAFAARPANTVAGDYYDVFFRPNERLLIVVADVAGKSVPAALLTATLQASLRTLAALPGSLAELVDRVNHYACEQSLQGRRFTTAFLAELEPVSGCLTYVNAGHNWPILRRASGTIERLETGGLPLGISVARPYHSGTAALAPGDLLLIFTDGIVEAENGQTVEYSEERLLPVIQGLDNATASESLKRLMTSVDGFVGPTRQHDDMTCLVVKMK